MPDHSFVGVPDKAELESLRDTAVGAACAAGAIQLRHFRGELCVDRALRHDVKLQIDRECEEAIIRHIRLRHPDHGIVSEESGVYPGASRLCWVVDPLDGTVNYFSGLPSFCTSIACYTTRTTGLGDVVSSNPARILDQGLVGVVHAAALSELYVGVRGCGVFRNDRRLPILAPTCLRDSVIGISFGSDEAVMSWMLEVTAALVRRARKIRCLGATALDLAYVASGHLGGLVQRGCRIWDVAAGRLLVEEAGGSVRAAVYEADRFDLMASVPGPIRTEMDRIIAGAGG